MNNLDQLKAVLPDPSDDALSIEDRARSVLHLLLDRFEGAPVAALVDPHRCPNCDQPTESLTGPYCSETCRDQAAFVRQFRAALGNGAILQPEKQLVFGERLWWLLGGGLPLRESRITESAKRQVARRSGGKCETCGAPMTDVENFGSGCNRHLRAACPRCYKTKPYNYPEFTRRREVVDLLTEFAQRIASPNPLRPCDDPESWDWRAFMAKRRNSA